MINACRTERFGDRHRDAIILSNSSAAAAHHFSPSSLRLARSVPAQREGRMAVRESVASDL
jgi:hypothetical protein